ncbi:MAG: gfo/Idh/MocA family oxidoreductase, partial [Candidatus Eisenbacteria bacterium]|nr:gfo/Idh/MocA family oxidoreductase [Candidatus Latescibacterota bacterium]MBD3302096.1 gfo/Idh/MocA family oxidoreductase [Candidatus Eisenbacteria bacterium]
MSKIPVAVIGCGHLGTFHARVYARDPRAELTVVADIVEERARALAEELGCAAATSVDAVLGKVAAASVATPTTTHEEVALPLLRAGIDVLVEKPIAPDPDAGGRIVEAARENDRVLAVGQIERCNPAFVEAREDLSAPRFIESHRLSVFVPRSLDVDVVLDLMIHDIDLVLSVARAPLESVDAIGVPVITQEADIANARLRFGDGSVANLTASRVSRERMRKIRFFDRNLYLSVDLLARRFKRARLRRLEDGTRTAGGARDPETAWLADQGLSLDRSSKEAASGDALATEIAGFLEASAGRGAPVVDGAAGLAALETALRVKQAVARSLARIGDLGT